MSPLFWEIIKTEAERKHLEKFAPKNWKPPVTDNQENGKNKRKKAGVKQ